MLYGDQARLFEDELHPHIRHRKKGMLGMASGGKDSNASQFYLTTADALDSLDEKRTLFGEVRPFACPAECEPLDTWRSFHRRIGRAAGGYKCRTYSADSKGAGAIDSGSSSTFSGGACFTISRRAVTSHWP